MQIDNPPKTAFLPATTQADSSRASTAQSVAAPTDSPFAAQLARFLADGAEPSSATRAPASESYRQLAELAGNQRNALIGEFLDYLTRHAAALETGDKESDYLRNRFNVPQESRSRAKMDGLLDEAPVLRQLFAVIEQQMESAREAKELKLDENVEARRTRLDEALTLQQTQLDEWQAQLRRRALEKGQG